MATVLAPPKMHSNDVSSTYTFSSMPRALLVQRRKLRDYNKADRDERIQGKINGPTTRNRLERSQYTPWSAWTSAVSSMPNGFEPATRSMDSATATPTPPPPTRLTLLRAQEHLRRTRTASSSPTTTTTSSLIAQQPQPPVPPVAGRKHIQVQTQLYLEELKDTIEESDATCQTDGLLLDRPSSAVAVVVRDFVPDAIAGIDVATQIEPDERHKTPQRPLFDFEMESGPVLEVMIGKAVEYAVIEVLQEEDLANIRRQQRRFQQLRNAYQGGERWIKEQENRMTVNGPLPIANKLEDRTSSDAPQFDMRQTIHSWSFVSDPIEKELERAFLPWVLDEVEDELVSRSTPDSSKNWNSGSTTRRSSDT